MPKRVPTAILLAEEAAAGEGTAAAEEEPPTGVRDDATGLCAPVARGVVARCGVLRLGVAWEPPPPVLSP